MSGPLSPTMTPNAPSAIARTAAPPNRSASSRSYVVGEPPRWRWPSTSVRVSLPDLARDTAEPVHRADAPTLDQLDGAVARPCALRHHHDAEAPACRLSRPDLLAHLLDVEGDFRQQDHVGAAREPAVERDPAGVTAHQLHHDHAVVALRSGVHLVERLGRRAHRAVEAEAALGAAHVVVDRLGHADDGEALAPELVRDLEAAVAADGHQRVEAARLEGGDQIVRAIDLRFVPVVIPGDVAKGIPAVGGTEDGTAQVGDAADLGRTQRDHAVEGEQPLVAPLDAVAAPAAGVGREHHRADDGVQSWSVTSARGYRDTHRRSQTPFAVPRPSSLRA
jgi:hypothetical protein